jgi:hypothetical protein
MTDIFNAIALTSMFFLGIGFINGYCLGKISKRDE